MTSRLAVYDEHFAVALFRLHFLNRFIGQEMMGDGKSLMEQLRGEALKFHKPGEMELKEDGYFKMLYIWDLKKKSLFTSVCR